jgi:hypothetical protein
MFSLEQKVEDEENIISSLERQLSEARARLNDYRGQLKTAQKEYQGELGEKKVSSMLVPLLLPCLG